MTRQFLVWFSYINLTKIADTVLLTLGAVLLHSEEIYVEDKAEIFRKWGLLIHLAVH